MQTNDPGTVLTPRQVDIVLRQRGARATQQRRAVHAALASRCDHPSAEAIYRQVRRRLPGLSRGTVYKALEILVRSGAARKLTHSDGVARYDARLDGHDHARCLGCGSVEDVDRQERPAPLIEQPGEGFTVTGYQLEIVGYCAACAGARHVDSHKPRSIAQGDQR